MRDNTDTKIFKILLWISRGLSVFLAGFVLFFFFSYLISDGLSQLSFLSPKEILLLITMAVMVLGAVFALKNKLVGGMMTIGGYLVFAIVDRNFWPGNYIPLFLMTGLLHIYLSLRLGKSKQGQDEGRNRE